MGCVLRHRRLRDSRNPPVPFLLPKCPMNPDDLALPLSCSDFLQCPWSGAATYQPRLWAPCLTHTQLENPRARRTPSVPLPHRLREVQQLTQDGSGPAGDGWSVSLSLRQGCVKAAWMVLPTPDCRQQGHPGAYLPD